MSKFLNLTTALALLAAPAYADGFGIGRPALPEEIAAWDLDVSPDGTGLPSGSGDVLTGEEVFAEKCAACHGDFAEGVDNWPKLAGGWDTLADEDPLKTVGSYWPHLSTAWDYINRSMPFGDAQSLAPDEVYAIVAYILFSNDLVDDDFVLDQDNLAAFELPNAEGFIVDDRVEMELSKWIGEPCMENCKDAVEVTMRARVLDVTPDEEGAEQAAVEVKEEAPVVEVAAVDPEMVAKGEKVFKKCKSCHQVGEKAKNRTGPTLNGIVGAAAGKVEGFKYSKALKSKAEEGLVWNAEELAAFLAKPKKYMKGTKMSFNGLKKESDIEAVTQYLQTFAE
ncbi:MAG: c-type cytochrome [Litoreibacter sp.]|nr:c-type cytochrome [Litoreibacter sp.]